MKLFGIAMMVMALTSPAAAHCACSGDDLADAALVAAAPEMPAATPAAVPEDVKTVASAFPGLVSAGLKEARLAELPEGTLLRSGEVTIKATDLSDEIDKAPEAVRGQLRKNAVFMLEQMATQQLLVEQARAAMTNHGKDASTLSDQEILEAYFDELTADVKVTDAEVADFYEKNKEMVGGQPLDAVKEPIANVLRQQKQQEIVGERVGTLGRRMKIEIDAAWLETRAELAMDNPVDKARASGKPSLVDFGAKGCIPCDKLAPILEAMEKKYEGRANVVFVSVREDQILASRYGIQSIPVQIFFDADGDEVFRHSGFWPQEELEKKLAEMGVK